MILCMINSVLCKGAKKVGVMRPFFQILILFILLVFALSFRCLASETGETGSNDGEWSFHEEDLDDPWDDFEEGPGSDSYKDMISDPLEPVNRVFFYFNDKLYFWFLKPVSTGYEKVVPQPARVCVRNFFSNILMPVRGVNCILQ